MRESPSPLNIPTPTLEPAHPLGDTSGHNSVGIFSQSDSCFGKHGLNEKHQAHSKTIPIQMHQKTRPYAMALQRRKVEGFVALWDTAEPSQIYFIFNFFLFFFTCAFSQKPIFLPDICAEILLAQARRFGNGFLCSGAAILRGPKLGWKLRHRGEKAMC